MPHAKHPLVAPDRANALADLVREGLKPETVIGRRQRAGDGIVWTGYGLRSQKAIDRFFEAALQEVFVAFEGDEGAYCVMRIAYLHCQCRRQVEPMNCV